MATDTASSITKKIINNILEWAEDLQHTAREYRRLGNREQAKVWNDLSGDEGRRRDFGADGKEYFTTGDLYEPDDLVQTALKDLSEELAKMPSKQKRSLDKAMEIAPEYIRNVNFQVKFLRAEKFDARLAAVRMALHFEEKYLLFGEEKLGRDILLSDLNEDDMDCLKSAYLQVLNELDFGNRKVIFYYKAISDCYKDRENLLRSFWYVANTISADEDVQKLGVVNVVYNLCGFPKNGIDYEKSRRIAQLFKAVPLRMCSFYPCIDTRAWAVAIETFSVIISKYLRVRFRIIKGDHEEVLLKLKSIGVPSEVLPVTDESKLLVDDHLEWIANQEEKEKEEREPAVKRSRTLRGQFTGSMSDLQLLS